MNPSDARLADCHVRPTVRESSKMDIFLSYPSSGLRETRELLRALERSFGSVDWIGNGRMRGDNVDGRYLLPSDQATQLDGLMKASEDSKVILLLVSPAFEMHNGAFDGGRYLNHTGVEFGRALNRAKFLEHFESFGIGSDGCSESYPVRTFQSHIPITFSFLQREPLAPPEDVPAVIRDCGDVPVLQPDDLSNSSNGLRIVMNMARSIRTFDSSTLRPAKSMTMLRLLASGPCRRR